MIQRLMVRVLTLLDTLIFCKKLTILKGPKIRFKDAGEGPLLECDASVNPHITKRLTIAKIQEPCVSVDLGNVLKLEIDESVADDE